MCLPPHCILLPRNPPHTFFFYFYFPSLFPCALRVQSQLYFGIFASPHGSLAWDGLGTGPQLNSHNHKAASSSEKPAATAHACPGSVIHVRRRRAVQPSTLSLVAWPCTLPRPLPLCGVFDGSTVDAGIRNPDKGRTMCHALACLISYTHTDARKTSMEMGPSTGCEFWLSVFPYPISLPQRTYSYLYSYPHMHPHQRPTPPPVLRTQGSTEYNALALWGRKVASRRVP